KCRIYRIRKSRVNRERHERQERSRVKNLENKMTFFLDLVSCISCLSRLTLLLIHSVSLVVERIGGDGEEDDQALDGLLPLGFGAEEEERGPDRAEQDDADEAAPEGPTAAG